MKQIQIIAILVVIALVGSVGAYALLSGSEDGEKEKEYPNSVTITQNDGKKVVVETPVERVALVNGNAAEFMQVLNVTDKVVGVSESIQEDDEFGYIYDGLPAIGTYSTPNGEMLLELEVDVVIGQCSAMPIKDPAALEALGITVVLLDCYGIGTQADDLRQLASLFGFEAQERAEQYIEIFNEVILGVSLAGGSFGLDKTVYVELGNGNAYTSTSEMSHLIDLAGGYNVVIDLIKNPTRQSMSLSNEVLIKYNNGYGPDFVLVREGGLDDAEAEAKYQTLTERNGWDKLNVTKEDKIYIVTQSGILSGPRVYIGLVYLAELFHPGVLEYSAEELLEEYNELFGYDITLKMDYHHVST